MVPGSRLVGVQHQLRADFVVKLLRRQEAQRHRGLLQGRALLVRLLCALGNVCGIQLDTETSCVSGV